MELEPYEEDSMGMALHRPIAPVATDSTDTREYVAASASGGLLRCMGEADARSLAGRCGAILATDRFLDPATGTALGPVEDLDRAIRVMEVELEAIRARLESGSRGWLRHG